MKLTEMRTNAQVMERDLADPVYVAEWNRTALARAVAAEVIRYRAENDLSQRALAAEIGMTQPRIAKIEIGEHNPSMDTLECLVEALDIEIAIDVRPRRWPAQLIKAQSLAQRVHQYETGRAAVTVAAAGRSRRRGR